LKGLFKGLPNAFRKHLKVSKTFKRPLKGLSRVFKRSLGGL
jgi:hypothetical protein